MGDGVVKLVELETFIAFLVEKRLSKGDFVVELSRLDHLNPKSDFSSLNTP